MSNELSIILQTALREVKGLTLGRRCGIALGIIVAVAGRTGTATALGGHWQPPHMHAIAMAPREALDAVRAESNALATARIERWSAVAGPDRFSVTARSFGADSRIDVTLGGKSYGFGRFGGERWRRTPNGLVRTLVADAQGDQLDRWPSSLYSIPLEQCDGVFLTDDATPLLVVEVRPPDDPLHWIYIDRAEHRIVREVVREGSENVTFAFADFRPWLGAVRPYAWRTSGFGGDADVRVDSVEPGGATASDVARPPSTSDAEAAFEGALSEIPASFPRGGHIDFDARVNGRTGRFILDTGTPQILIADNVAAHFGLTVAQGHTMISDLAFGAVRLHDVAAMTVPLDSVDGILGLEAFPGHVVRIDYPRERVEFISHEAFVPPPGARGIDADFSSGLPFVSGAVGERKLARIALDTGSFDFVVLRSALESGGVTDAELGVERKGPMRNLGFLEGTIATQTIAVRSLRMGSIVYQHPGILRETKSGLDAVDFTFDAIAGRDFLAPLVWFFDYDNGRIWYCQKRC